MPSQAERLFNEEIRDKKRTGRGIHSRTGTRGYVGKMLFPTDILRGAEKRKHKQNGKVKVWNMYQDIMDYNYFSGLTQQDQKKVLESLREKHSNSKIIKEWGLNNASYYNMVNELGLKKKQVNTQKNKQKLTEEQLSHYKKEIIPFNTYKGIEIAQQHYLLTLYLQQMNVPELATAWGTSKANVYSYTYAFKKKVEQGLLDADPVKKPNLLEMAKNLKERFEAERMAKNEPAPIVENENNEAEIEESESELDVPVITGEIESSPQNDDMVVAPISETVAPIQQDSTELREETPTRNYGTTLSFDGEYTQEQLRKKLLTMAELLEGDGRFYKMNISFTEIQEN